MVWGRQAESASHDIGFGMGWLMTRIDLRSLGVRMPQFKAACRLCVGVSDEASSSRSRIAGGRALDWRRAWRVRPTGVETLVVGRGRCGGRRALSDLAVRQHLHPNVARSLDPCNQREPSSMARDDLGSMWEGQLKAWEAADNVVVADLNGTQRVIVNAVNEGTLSAFTAERLLDIFSYAGGG